MSSSEKEPLLPLPNRGERGQAKLTTFFGVFIPCVLSIFSVILFIRLGYIVGQSGLLVAIAMFSLAYVIIVLTVLSISAISTNGAIKGGGAYFMISRALGPEFGGSVGLIFYFANVFGASLYTLGVVEPIISNFGDKGALTDTLPVSRGYQYLYGTAVLFVCLSICLIGADMFAKTSFLIFIVVTVVTGVVILSFFLEKTKEIALPSTNDIANPNETYSYTGLNLTTFRNNLLPHFGRDYSTHSDASFAIVFGVLFNGCTGVMAGANLSGDLAKPSRSIPLGTILACLYTFILYIGLSLLVAASCEGDLLRNQYNVLQLIDIWPPLVAVGILTITLSAALSTLIGASRILHAVAMDDIFGPLLKPFKIVNRNNNPWAAVLISWFFVQIIIAIKELNLLAQISSVFFLVSYATVNLAALALELASAPNFRPTFRYCSWITSLGGMVGSFAMMFVVSQIYAAIVVGVMILLFVFISFYSGERSWGYISQALIFHQVRKYLLMLDPRKEHVKFWRPQILLLVSNPRSSSQLIQFVNDMKKGGLYVVGNVILGNIEDGAAERREKQMGSWISLVARAKVKAFTEITIASSVRLGIQSLAMTSGLGGMKPTTVMLGFYDAALPQDKIDEVLPPHKKDLLLLSEIFPALRRQNMNRSLSSDEYVSIIYDCLDRLKKNVVLARNFGSFDRQSLTRSTGYIDIWPINPLESLCETIDYSDTTVDYMLQLGCVLHMVPIWKKSTRIRVFTIGLDRQSAEEKRAGMIQKLRDIRIPATVHAVVPALPTYIQYPEHGSQTIDDPLQFICPINELMKLHSGGTQTKVVFCYMWRPPTDPSFYRIFLGHLEAFTANLPPTLLVRGLKKVTMTSQ
jgi:potassium/chloride transporter 9